MIQYAICLAGAFIFFTASAIAVNHNHEVLGTGTLVACVGCVMVMIGRFLTCDVENVCSLVVNFIRWLIIG